VLEAIKKQLSSSCFGKEITFDTTFLQKKDKISFEELLEIKLELSKIMEEKCGVLREEGKMQNALFEVSTMLLSLQSKAPLINSLIFSNAFVLYFELQNLLILSIEVLNSAIKRKESRGSHSRTDYPNINPFFAR
jgi:succinate dehydrogenase/fumarate reductase flavoprotein subunit